MNSQQHHVYVDDQILVYDQAACSSLTLAVIITQEKKPKAYPTPSYNDEMRKAHSVRPVTKTESPTHPSEENEKGFIHSMDGKYHI